jgi:hypothetical protein
MASSAPGTVTIAGRKAFTISTLGLALSSERQNATSPKTAPATVYPRSARHEAVWISMR